MITTKLIHGEYLSTVIRPKLFFVFFFFLNIKSKLAGWYRGINHGARNSKQSFLTYQALAITERYQRIGLIFYVSGVMTVKLVSSNLIAFLDYQPRRCKIRVFGENKTQFFPVECRYL